LTRATVITGLPINSVILAASRPVAAVGSIASAIGTSQE
jgi:hypothetical protein